MRSRWTGLRLAGAAVVLLCGQFAVSAAAVTVHHQYGADTLGSPGPGGTLNATPTSKPRAAFTDDSDQIESYTPSSDGTYFSDSGAAGFASATARYEGQANAYADYDGDTAVAFVSTRAGAAGDVFVQDPDLNGGDPVRVTCDGYTNSHPVVLVTDGGHELLVAYASNAPGAGNDGHINIWVAKIGLGGGTLLAAPADDCSAVNSTSPLTGQSGDNTWPAWTGTQYLYDSSDDVTNTLLYASTRANPLGDIYEQCAGPCDDGLGGSAGVSSDAQRRTFGSGVGNTEPTVVNDGELSGSAILVVTTTQFRPDGSLASTVLPAPDVLSPADTAVTSLWPGDSPPQSSQAAYADACLDDSGYTCGSRQMIAYVSTENDPYGDVSLQSVTMGSGSLQSDGTASVLVADTPGVAELEPSFATTPNDGYSTTDAIYVTVRSGAAGISTAVAADGSGRLPFVSAETYYDYSQPAYSPDGTKIAYSVLTTSDSESPSSRVIMIANADGTGTPVQLETQPADVDTGMTVRDTQPAWSPDGKKIAFTRVALSDDVWTTTVQWAAVPSGSVPSAPNQVTPESSDPYVTTSDMDPSWSPDGAHLVLTRAQTGSEVTPNGFTGSTALRDGNRATYDDPVLYVVNASTGQGGPIMLDDGCFGDSPCEVGGRSAAWSPTGNQIVYDDSGMLKLLTLPSSIPVTPSSAGITATSTTLIGFDDFDPGAGGTPTTARKTITAAHDPAWSPDGKQLYFTGLPLTQPTNPGIYAMLANGTGLRTVAQQAQPDTEPTAEAITGADIAVTVVPSTSPAYVGGKFTLTVTVTNYGPAAASGVVLTFALPGTLVPSTTSCLTVGTCTVGTLGAGQTQVYTVLVTPKKQGDPAHGYTATIIATLTEDNSDPAPANDTLTLPLPVKQPKLRMLPSVGPPGFVTLAYGEDFPPGAKVAVLWKPGINAYAGPFTVAADGTLRVPMLIVRRDQLGSRLAQATSKTHEFGAVTAPMLVVPRTESPPRFLGRS